MRVLKVSALSQMPLYVNVVLKVIHADSVKIMPWMIIADSGN